jgi:uncharacterized membrane protein
VWHRLRTYFLAGLVVFAPISITIFLTWKVIGGIDGFVRGLLPTAYNPETYLAVNIPGIGLLITFVFLTMLGALAANFLGRSLIRLGEALVERTPVIRGIYTTVKQIAQTVMAQSSTTFRDVVMIEYPRPGLWAIAFVSSNTTNEIQQKTAQVEMLNVFLPTTPNPTSGFLLFVRKSDCIYLDMTIEQAIKYIISAGLVSPEELPLASPKHRPSEAAKSSES